MKRISTLLTVLVLVSVLTACGAQTVAPTAAPAQPTAAPAQPSQAAAQPTAQPVVGGTLTIRVGALKQFDYALVLDDASFHVISQVYSFLFRTILINGTPSIIPDLATSWKFGDDNSLTFTLRQGVKFQDDNAVFPKGQSREVVADDVVYSLKRYFTVEGSTAWSDLVDAYQDAQVIDKYTVKILFKHPDALLFSDARGLTGLAIVPREAVEKLGADFAMNPVGSGPYKFQSYKPDDSLVLVRNDLYWKKPNLDQVVFKIIPDDSVATIAFQKGEVDLLQSVPAADFGTLNADKNVQINATGCPLMTQFMFNMKGMFSDVKFRQALAYAIDGDGINQSVYGAQALPGGGAGCAGPGVPGYDSSLYKTYFAYNPEKAKQLFEELGWVPNSSGLLAKDGKVLTIPIEIPSMSPYPQYAAAIVSQLKEIGVTGDLQTTELSTWLDDWNKGVDKMLIMEGWCGEGGTDGLLGRTGMATTLGYDDAQVYDLLDASNLTFDAAKHDELIRQAVNRMSSLYWFIPMGFHNSFDANRTYVHDFGGKMWFLNLCTEKNNVWVAK